MPRSLAGKSTVGVPSKPEGLAEAPAPPADIDLPHDYCPKKCRRCGVWSTEPAPYDQSKSQEHQWKTMVAWEAGCLRCPLGLHCLIYRKARIEHTFC